MRNTGGKFRIFIPSEKIVTQVIREKGCNMDTEKFFDDFIVEKPQ